MITLTVLSFNGQAADAPLSASFDELGGSIGRADTNQLVLPDPERSISRVHAQVVFRNGGYAVIDRGSNPISVNGKPVGNGREVPLPDGAQLQIGGYLLGVQQAAGGAARSAADPFADLLGTPAAAPRAGGSGSPLDPLAAFGFDAPPAPPLPPAYAAPPAAPVVVGGIPDDWDPFAPDPQPASVPAAAQDFARSLGAAGSFGFEPGAGAPAPLVPDLPAPAAESSLDSLFGLKAGAPGGDPFANSALDGPLAQPNTAAHADPFASLSSPTPGSERSMEDRGSDLQRPFQSAPLSRPATPPAVPPTGMAAPVPREPAPAASVPPPAPAAFIEPPAPSGAVLSWDDAGGDGRTVIRAAVRPAAAAPPAAAPVAPPPAAAPATPAAAWPPVAPAPVAAAVPAPRPPVMPAPPPAAATAPAATAAPMADTQALLDAFRAGLATPTVQIPALTPELMHLVGQLLHEAAAGTVDLLVARAALKREVRAESTMIVARENNPLKFSPSAEAALGHLLAPPTRGFMAAAPAMRDAYDDLRAHQFGFIAGMRAALEGVLGRFDPAELEGRLTQGSVLQSLLPGSRKARMWEVFVELYAKLRSEASDDFHTLFGKAFLKAYEEHIDQLKGDRP